MEIIKYSEFFKVNEARVKKEEVVTELVDMLKKKPNVEMDKLPNERGLYGLAGMKKYLSKKYTSHQVSLALHDLQNDKKSGLKSVYVKIAHWNKPMPYWYMDMTEAEVAKLKKEYEAEDISKNKESLEKEKENKKAQKASATAKKTAKKKATATKTAAKKSVGTGVERKAGGTTAKRKTATKK